MLTAAARVHHTGQRNTNRNTRARLLAKAGGRRWAASSSITGSTFGQLSDTNASSSDTNASSAWTAGDLTQAATTALTTPRPAMAFEGRSPRVHIMEDIGPQRESARAALRCPLPSTAQFKGTRGKTRSCGRAVGSRAVNSHQYLTSNCQVRHYAQSKISCRRAHTSHLSLKPPAAGLSAHARQPQPATCRHTTALKSLVAVAHQFGVGASARCRAPAVPRGIQPTRGEHSKKNHDKEVRVPARWKRHRGTE